MTRRLRPRSLSGLALIAALAACSSSTPSEPPSGAPDAGPGLADAATPDDAGTVPDAGVDPAGPPITILMIGDGMGYPQLDLASLYAHGARGRLHLQSLPHAGELTTGSVSGITDSAASATAMATGVKTKNRRDALDRLGRPLETLVERAHALGMPAGIVTTAAITHGTPGAFTAHQLDRGDYLDVADDQALRVRPEVMLGGGANAWDAMSLGSERSDEGHVERLRADGWTVARSRDELAAAPATGKLLGLFADIHLEYVADRPSGTAEPTLAEMSLAALRQLEVGDRGFFLMIEGAKIDMAAHENATWRTAAEVLAFDQAVKAVTDWAADKPNVSLIVTGDHECGGLEITQDNGMDVLADVSWRWLEHTNQRVPVYAMGPRTELFDDSVRPNTWVHAALAAWLERRPVMPPVPALIPDGDLAELPAPLVEQTLPSDLGDGLNRLGALRVAQDEHGVLLGVDGVFEWDRNALVLLVDVDLGAGTGPAALRDVITDRGTRVARIAGGLPLEAPAVAGFGADWIGVAFGGFSPHHEAPYDEAGLGGLRPPFGRPDAIGWQTLWSAFGEGVRGRVAAMPAPGQGWEVFLPWDQLYGGPAPADAVLGVAILLVDSGGGLSSQALPPFDPAAPPLALPGVVRIPRGGAPEVLR